MGGAFDMTIIVKKISQNFLKLKIELRENILIHQNKIYIENSPEPIVIGNTEYNRRSYLAKTDT